MMGRYVVVFLAAASLLLAAFQPSAAASPDSVLAARDEVSTTTVVTGQQSTAFSGEGEAACAGVQFAGTSAAVDDARAASEAQRHMYPRAPKRPTDAAIELSVAAPNFVAIEQRGEGEFTQILGQADRAERFTVTIRHYPACDDVASVRLESADAGGVNLIATRHSGEEEEVSVDSPWAFDRNGDPVPTWYELDGAVLKQVVDAAGARPPVTFDPTYTFLSCVAHWTMGDARFYVDMFGTTDTANCPPLGMLEAARGYRPVWGYETNIANDYGKVIVRQDGQCSDPAPDTGPSFDFQVPCRAHDYCYDLRAASLEATVTDSACDSMFYDLMEAHCNNRSFPLNLDCRNYRDAYHFAVTLPGVETFADPGPVEIRNSTTGQCADVEGPLVADGTPIQQWGCVSVPQQRWKIWPMDGYPGYFKIVSDFSGKCIAGIGPWNIVIEQACNVVDHQRFKIQGALNMDLYSLRDGLSGYQNCINVPFSTNYGTDLQEPVCDDFSHWYIWRIVSAS